MILGKRITTKSMILKIINDIQGKMSHGITIQKNK
jgi:hypothetical protein